MKGLIFNVSRYGKTLYFSYPIDDTRPIPIPGIPLAMGTTSDNSSVTFIEGYSTYPTLDVSTIEIPLQSRHLFHGRLKRAPPAEDACRLDNITISFEGRVAIYYTLSRESRSTSRFKLSDLYRRRM